MPDDLRGQIVPPLDALELGEQRRRPRQQRLDDRRVRLDPHEAPETTELRKRDVRGAHRRAHVGERGRGVLVHREIERGELGEVLADRGVDANQLARVAIDAAFGGPPGRLAGPQPLLEQRHDALATLRRQIQSIEGRRQDFGRRRFEVEQQEQRLGEIEIRKITQHGAVGAAVEQPRQNRALEQIFPPIRLEV